MNNFKLKIILAEIERRGREQQPMPLLLCDYEGNVIGETKWPACSLTPGFTFTLDMAAMTGRGRGMKSTLPV